MEARLKIGGHTGPNGYGIPDYFIAELDTANIPVFMKSADGTAGIYKVQQVLSNGSQVPHTGVFRLSTAGQDDGYDYDVPNYNLSPQQASDIHWQQTLAKLPPELDFSLLWLETVNELNPNLEKASWIGNFLYYQGLKALENGFKFCGPGYASGDPIEGSWETVGMLNYLRLCEQHPNQLGVALHEYSLADESLWTKKDSNGDIVACTEAESGYYLLGRFTKLYEVCDSKGIQRPKVLLTEWGWSLWGMAQTQPALEQIINTGAFYAQYPNVLGGAIWYLGGGWNDLKDKVWTLFDTNNRLLNATLETIYDVAEPELPENQIVLYENFNAMDGWYDINSIQQCRHGWTLETILEGNPDSTPLSVPEAVFRWDRYAAETYNLGQPQIPDHEAGILTNEDGFCYKIFASSRAWWVKHIYDTYLDAGKYEFGLTYYDDNFVDYVNGVKVPPPDPLSFEYKINFGNETTGWINSNFLQENIININFESDAPSQISYEFRGRWGLMNVGVFVKNVKLTELVAIPPAEPKHTAVVVKAPQPHESSKEDWLALADYSYEYAHTMTASTDDMINVLLEGNDESYAKVYKPTLSSQVEAIERLDENDIDWIELVLEQTDDPLYNIDLGHLFNIPYAITSHFNEPRGSYPGNHEGTDYDVLTNIPDSKEPVLCVYDGIVDSSKLGNKYGEYVRVKHNYKGYEFYTWYCHLDARYVQTGETVNKGTHLGEIGTTGNVTGEHVHFNLVTPEYGLEGYVIDDVIDPETKMPNSNTPENKIDILSFMIADPTAWRVVRHPDGQQEDFQDYNYGNGEWAMVKSGKAEWWQYDSNYIYLTLDNSPAPASDGTERFYEVNPGKWCKREMSIGEVFNDGGHFVQFYNIHNCQAHGENSGNASNTTKLIKLEQNYTFNSFGQNLTLDEVLFIQGNTETQIFAKHQGKSLGRVGWVSEWGESEIVELYFDRGILENPPTKPCF